MIDSTVTRPADETTADTPTSLSTDVRAALRKPQTLITVAWPVVTYVLGFSIGAAL